MNAQPVSVSLDRASPVPLYHQLAEQLSRSITEGNLQPGDAFENELSLAQRLHISRPTVRRAIQELVDQGLLIRQRGLGTTVANRRVHRRFRLSSLYDELTSEGREPGTVVLDMQTARDASAAAGLDLPTDTPLLQVIRVRTASGTPLAILHNWLPPAHSDLSREELEAGGLYEALRGRGVRPVVAQQSIGARMPTRYERRHLQLKGSQPVLTMTRIAFDSTGTPVEYGNHCYRADDYTIDLMIDER